MMYYYVVSHHHWHFGFLYEFDTRCLQSSYAILVGMMSMN